MLNNKLPADWANNKLPADWAPPGHVAKKQDNWLGHSCHGCAYSGKPCGRTYSGDFIQPPCPVENGKFACLPVNREGGEGVYFELEGE